MNLLLLTQEQLLMLEVNIYEYTYKDTITTDDELTIDSLYTCTVQLISLASHCSPIVESLIYRQVAGEENSMVMIKTELEKSILRSWSLWLALIVGLGLTAQVC